MEMFIATLETIGTLSIAWAALSVHHRVLNEHKISSKVFRVMHAEQKLANMGMFLIIVSYILNIFY